MKKFFRVWLVTAKMVILPDLVSSGPALLFILGKIVRFLLYFLFLFQVLAAGAGMAGYSAQEVILFFLIFNLVDTTIQFLFRGVYHFRGVVASGNFDLDLVKPLPSFFRPVFGHIDIMDFITLVPLFGFFIWYAGVHHLTAGAVGVFAFIILFLSSLLFGFAFHLFISAICVLTLEIDHLVWIYRDLTAAARFPTDIYRGFMRFLITFVVPVVLLITFPAKGLLGLLSWDKIILSVFFSIFSVILSLKFWRYSLKKYTSASS